MSHRHLQNPSARGTCKRHQAQGEGRLCAAIDREVLVPPPGPSATPEGKETPKIHECWHILAGERGVSVPASLASGEQERDAILMIKLHIKRCQKREGWRRRGGLEALSEDPGKERAGWAFHSHQENAPTRFARRRPKPALLPKVRQGFLGKSLFPPCPGHECSLQF